jgi:uncharacterized protein
MNLRSIMFDGISIQVTDQGAQAIEKLQGQNATLTADNLRLSGEISTKDTEIGTLKAQLADAQKKPTVDVDALVADRLVLVDTARKILPDLKVEGLKDADIRRAVVVAKYGEDIVKDSSEDQISAMFKVATKDAAKAPNADPVRGVMMTQTDSAGMITLGDHGQTAYEKRLADAWKQ